MEGNSKTTQGGKKKKKKGQKKLPNQKTNFFYDIKSTQASKASIGPLRG